MTSEAFHKGKYFVTLKRGFEDSRRDIIITLDKVFENDCLKIVLSDETDPSFLCILQVTRCDYEDLKKQQGLLIDFDNFPAQLVRLLQQCSVNNMFLILQQANPLLYHLEIVEHNEFKRLVHLSLKTTPANDADVKRHMADTISNLKNSLSSVKCALSNSEAVWSDKYKMMECKVNDLTVALTKMEDERRKRDSEFQEAIKVEKDKLAQERQHWQTNSEMTAKVQMTTMQENLSRKDKQIDDLNCIIKQQKDKILQQENQLCEKNQRLSFLETEIQKAHIETATMKAKHSTLERDVLDKDKQFYQLSVKCNDLEKVAKDNAEVIKELNNSIKLLTKEKNSLNERLAISESLVNKNNEAAHNTSEQLIKANQIISKQNNDLLEMKDKIMCRTAIALEQEKVIEKNSKEIESLKSEIITTRAITDKLNSELDLLKEKYDISEKALKDKEETIKNNNLVIQWLHKKLEGNASPEVQSKRQGVTLTSSPYFISRNQNELAQGVSDESINFYATTKSDIDESSGQNEGSSENRLGLDPKYLKPASDERIKKNTDRKDKKIESKGKENKIVNLPKVNYREKGSSKGTTYRSTPVSAYFP